MIAALYVDPRGVYANLPGVDLWDEKRDARLYAGPHPVVAHPPCSRWCRLAGLVEARYGHKRGEDGGCFEAALRAVRTWGGVLEHPAYSDAWRAFALPVPGSHGWQRGICGGWSAAVAQCEYGHRARKATWLYAYGVSWLPELRWGIAPDHHLQPVRWRDSSKTEAARVERALVSYCDNKSRARRPIIGRAFREEARGDYDDRPRLSKREAKATPIEFRDLLIGIAESANLRRPTVRGVAESR